MSSLFERMNEEGHINGLDIKKKIWLTKLGLYGEEDRVILIDLNETATQELNDLLVDSLYYIENISEVLAECDKRKRDAESDMDVVFNRAVSSQTGLKVTEAKALAKGSEIYQTAQKKYNTLYAWSDYLKRYMDTLEKYHYAVKNRLQIVQTVKDKHGMARE
jgi:hypothetical protein